MCHSNDDCTSEDPAAARRRTLPALTVAICTRDRSALLRQTLASLTRLTVPPAVAWDVLVIDNASSDETSAVIEEFTALLPLRAIVEPTAGKSFAANTAVREATGEFILWTDDDVQVAPDWLEQYVGAIIEHPETGIFGGPIYPWFEGSPPRWLKRAFPSVATAYAALDRGPATVPLSRDVFPYGANMVVKRSLHLQKPFDTRIGPRPGSKVRGEEWVLVMGLLESGKTGFWIPGASVRHFIPRERQSVGYLRSYFIGTGQLYDYLEPLPPGARLFGRPLWLWKEAVLTEMRYRLRRPFVEPERWVEDLKRASVSRGRLIGLSR